jgi:MFS family permease
VGAIDLIAPPRLGRPFRWLLGSSWVSNIGDGVALAAAPLLIASQTRDPFLISLAALAQRTPWLFIGLYAGVLADRVDRRRLIVIGNVVRVIVLAGLTATIVGDRVDVTIVLAALFVLATAEVFVDISTGTLLPMVVSSDDLGIANSRLFFGMATLNQLVGPALGAALFAIGSAIPFGSQAAAMALAAVLVSRIAVSRPALPDPAAPPVARSVRREIREGTRWLWAHRPMRTLTITIFTFNLAFGALIALLVLLSIERLGLGEFGFGLLTSASAAGAVIGSVLYVRTERAIGMVWIMRIGLVIETLTYLVFAVTTVAWIAMAMFFVFGIHAAMWGTTSTTVRQRAVPAALQGRIGSVYLVAVQGGIAIGAALGGLISSIWGVASAYWFAFAISAAALAAIWRELRHIAEAPAG